LNNSIAWNSHYIYYKDKKYTVAAGNTGAPNEVEQQRVAYVYVDFSTADGLNISYSVKLVAVAGDYPDLSDVTVGGILYKRFMIATNVNGVS